VLEQERSETVYQLTSTVPPMRAGGRRLDSLTGVRGVAAMAVVACHYGVPGLWGKQQLGALAGAVDVFFVLSGFVMVWTWRPGDRAGSFWRRRFARIYPLVLLTVGVSTLLDSLYVSQMTPATALSSVEWLTLTATWTLHPIATSIDPPMWSLCCEGLFYASFPLLVVGMVRLSPLQRRSLAVVCVASSWLVLGTTTGTLLTFPPTRLPEFLVGMVVAFEVRDGWRPPSWLVAVIVAPTIAASIWLPATSDLDLVSPMVGAAVLIAWLAGRDLAERPTPLASRPMVALGLWSYALYLLHLPVLWLVTDVWNVTCLHLGYGFKTASHYLPWVTALTYVIAIGVAAVAHIFVEAPMERFIRTGRQGLPAAVDVSLAWAGQGATDESPGLEPRGDP
jgi:peptidoglycan/LPS O-acetylase OafA/YrhL